MRRGIVATTARGGLFARQWRTLIVVALIVAMLTLAGVPVLRAVFQR